MSDVAHNLCWDRRFLFNEDWVLDPNSHIIVPVQLSVMGATRKAVNSFQAEGSGENPRKVLEDMLRRIKPVKAKDFEEMKKEFQTMFEEGKSDRPGGRGVNYQSQQELQKGIRVVDDMLNVEAHAQDVLQFMSQSLLARDEHFQYLTGMEKVVSDVRAMKSEYENKLEEQAAELNSALKVSLSLKLPKDFKQYPQLAFNGVFQKQENSTSFKPSAMHELGCKNLAIATYTVKALKKKKVVVEIIHPDL